MATEIGNFSRLAYIQEVIFGTTPSTPTGQTLRQDTFDFGAERKYIDNMELRTDGMTAAGIGGTMMGKGSTDSALSYGSFDDLLAAALGNFTWTSNVVKVRPIIADSSATLAVDSGAKTFTRPAGSFVTDGFAVGDYIVTTGFANAGNNSVFVVSGVTATVITCSTATGLVTEGANAAGNISLNTRPSFTMERAHLVNGLHFPYTGVVVDGFEMSGKVDEAVRIKFDLLAKSVGTESNTSVFTAISAVNSNDLITSWQGSISKDSVPLTNVTGWTIKATRNMDTAEVVGSSALYDIQPKSAKITGTLELYFSDFSLYTAMRAETDLELEFALGPGVNFSYEILLEKVRIKNWKSVPKDGLMTATVEFESFAPDSGTNTSMKITRLP